MKSVAFHFVFIMGSITVSAAPSSKFNLIIAPGSITENSVTLLWDKQSKNAVYEIHLDGKLLGATTKTNYTVSNLSSRTTYRVQLRIQKQKIKNSKENSLQLTTTAKGKIYNILDYGAKDDSVTINTKAIQSAIDACTTGGTVYIPAGTFISGALYLKSNMTLYIEKDGVL